MEGLYEHDLSMDSAGQARHRHDLVDGERLKSPTEPSERPSTAYGSMEGSYAHGYSMDSAGQARHRHDEEEKLTEPSERQSTAYGRMEEPYVHEYSVDSAGQARHRHDNESRYSPNELHLAESHHQREYYKLQEQRYKAESF